MGIFDFLFRDDSRDSDGNSSKVVSKGDSSRVSHDRFTFDGNGKHNHDSYTYDRNTGNTKEYSGGKNSGDRSYNKK